MHCGRVGEGEAAGKEWRGEVGTEFAHAKYYKSVVIKKPFKGVREVV